MYLLDTIFVQKNSNGHNSVETVYGVADLVLCTSHGGSLYLHQIS